ncbi:phytoene desaturase family protein [Baekduia sp. Peel2402]|uniref:phytoene desaturase family protein n=1 Tax=Baekduia sp. Peel2402 TaxID=3458296 RepID=UPI00403E8621
MPAPTLTPPHAIVVGSGPNGLTAAATLALAGVRVTVLEAEATIGGGTRSGELTLPGLLHDHCSAIHPLAVATHRDLDVTWARAPVELAHPFDDGTAAMMMKDIDATARGLARDGDRWRRLFSMPALRETDVLRPLLSTCPRHPASAARLGLLAAMPATVLTRAFATPQARALFAGVAAHASTPLSRPVSSAAGVLLIWAAHRHGWPVAVGGSRSIAAALAAIVREHGGTVLTDHRVTSLAELPPADVTLLDLTPSAAARLAGDRLPARVRRAYGRYPHGPDTFKLDLAVAGGIPWTAAACRAAGTIHAVGSVEELTSSLRDVHAGRVSTNPFVIVTQQSLADPSRAAGEMHPVSAYTSVPRGFAGDATELVLAQLERFAPALRSRLRASTATTHADILSGATTVRRAVFGPRLTTAPYATGIPGVLLCSAATPPGPGAHGMSGHHAAHAALAFMGRSTQSA